MKFGDTIRTHRKARKLSQKKLVERLQGTKSVLHQSTLASWESNKQLPREEEIVLALAEEIGANPRDLVEQWNIERETELSPDYTLRAYIENHGTALNKIGRRNAEVWILNADRLVGDTTLTNEWWSDLATGVNYHLLWVFDNLSDEGVGKMGYLNESFTDIKDSLEGEVFNHGISLGIDSNGRASRARRIYDLTREDLKDNRSIKFENPIELRENNDERVTSFNPLGSTSIYYRTGHPYARYVSIQQKGISSVLDGAKNDLWSWIQVSDTNCLQALISNVRKAEEEDR